MEEKKYYQIGSLEKGLKILEAIIEHGELTVTKAAGILDINRASAHRFIATLRDMGYVRKNNHNNYEATFKLLEMGMKQADKFEIRRMAKPVMRDLAVKFDETVNLGLLDNCRVVYLDKVESRELLRMDSGIGTTCVAHASALGKAMLAFLSDEEQESYIETMNPVGGTPHTITDQARMVKEMTKIRRQGYAVDNEELALDLYCIAAPIFDFNGYPSYAMSVSGPARRIKAMKEIPQYLMAATETLSRQLGFRGGLRL